MREYRSTPPGEVRTVGDPDRRQFVARVLNYDRLDSFRTTFAPGSMGASLARGMPKSVFAHDWARPIGRVIDYADGPEGLDVTVQLADPDAVPDARMVHSLLSDGVLDSFSIGFVREADEPDPNHEGATRITRAALDEISPVLIAAVPDTKLLAVRSAVATDPDLAVDAALVTDVAELLRTGAMDAEQARATLVAAARPVETPEETTLPLAPIEPGEVTPAPPGPPETPEAPPLDPGGDPLEPVDPGPPVQPVDPEQVESDQDDGAELALALATIDGRV